MPVIKASRFLGPRTSSTCFQTAGSIFNASFVLPKLNNLVSRHSSSEFLRDALGCGMQNYAPETTTATHVDVAFDHDVSCQ
jgi:hypothetical protein